MKNLLTTLLVMLFMLSLLAQPAICPDPGATRKKVASSFHSSVMIDYNGDVKYWGDGANPAAPALTSSFVVSPTTLSPSLYSGTPVAVAASSVNTGGDSVYHHQLYLLTTSGLYGWGASNRTITASAAATAIVGITLPTGITAANINFIASSGGGIAIITKIVGGIGGSVYIKNGAASGGASAYTYGDGTVSGFNVNWHRVSTSSGFLTNVARLSYSQKAVMVQTDNGTVCAWGEQVWTGNPLTLGNQALAKEISLPKVDLVPVIPADINIITKTAFKVDTIQSATQFILGTNGKLYGIGDGYCGILGQGDSTDATNWLPVKGEAGGSTELSDIVQISSNNSYVYADAYYSIGALNSSGQLFLWGENSSRMLGGSSRIYVLPRIPGNFSVNKARVGYFHMGGHTTIAFLQGSNRFCYVGHLIRGSMGNGNIATATKTSFDCINTPDAYVCPPPPPLGCAAPSSNDLVASSNSATLVINGQPSVSYWGTGSSSAEAGVNVPTPRVLYEYNGTPKGVAASAINDNTGATQMWILTSEGIWGWGVSARTINDALSGVVGLTTLVLPVPVADISFIRSSRGGIALVTTEGSVYIKAGSGSVCNASVYGDGTAALNSSWHRVTKTDLSYLTGVTELSFAGTAAIAITSAGVYTWGTNTYQGNGTAMTPTRNRAILMSVHADFTATMVPKSAEIIQAGANGAALFLLGSNGKVYALGADLDGVLGQGGTGEKRSWALIPTLSTVRKLSSNNPYANGFYSMGALTLNGTVFLWGSNSAGMLGGGESLSFNTPTIPTGIPAGSIAGFDIGGRQTIVFPKTSNQFYFAGRNSGGSKGDNTADGDIINFSTGAEVVNCAGVVYDIGGFIHNDMNGVKNGVVDGPGISKLGEVQLFANLLDESGYVVGSTTISATSGGYTFTGFPSGNYSVQISSEMGTLFSLSAAWSLPAGWAFVGDQLGNVVNSGIDVTPDARLAIALTGSVSNANIGFNRIPVASAVSNASPIIAPVGSNAFGLPELRGSDAEDMPVETSLAGKTIVIVSLPLNGKLYYNNSLVIINEHIGAYEADKLTFDPDYGAGIVEFSYSYADAAGVNSAPATITATLSYLSVSGHLFHDLNGLNDAGGGLINGSFLNNINGTPLFCSLVDPAGTGTILATSAIQPDGSYSFSNNVPAGIIHMVLHTNPGGSVASSLPAGWSSSGEQQGTSAGSGMLLPANGQAELVTTSADFTDVNFGVEQAPVALSKSFYINQPFPGLNIPLNGTLAGNSSPPDQLTGNDEEDAPSPDGFNGNSADRTIVIKSLSPNGTLLYNNVPVIINEKINNYDKNLLSITLTGEGYTSTGFTYAFQDAASVSSNDASYSINWNAVLPVTFLPLIVFAEGQQARLEWSTVMEQSNRGFEIQRSTDGITWITLGMITSKAPGGISNTLLKYGYLDDSPRMSLNYYRLKQVNFDNQHQYSAIKTILFSSGLKLALMPNPATDQVWISGLKAGQVLQLKDGAGRLLQQINIQRQTESLDVKKLITGTYIIQVIERGKLIGTMRFLRQ